MLLITQVLLGFLVVLTEVAEAVPVLQLNTTSVIVDPIPVGGSSSLADEKTGPYRLTFFKSAIGNKDDTTNENNNKTVEVLMNKSNEEINQTVHADESSMEEVNDPIEMKFTGGDWSKKLTKIIDKESSSGIDSSSSSSSSSEEDSSSSSSSSEEDSSENGSGDSSEEEEEEEEGSEEEEEGKQEEESKEEEEEKEEEEGGSEEENEEEEEGEEEEEEKEEEEEDEEGKEIEKVFNVDIKKTSTVITPAGTQLMNSSNDDAFFHEMQRHHKQFGLTTKGTQLLFTTGLIPSPFYSHFLQDNSIIPSSSSNPSTTPSSNNIKTLYSDWLKSLPEMKKLYYPSSHPHFISSSIVKPIKKNKADDDVNKSSGNQLTPGGTRLVNNDDHHHWLSLYRNGDVIHRQPSLLDDDSVQRFFRSTAAFRTLSPPPQ